MSASPSVWYARLLGVILTIIGVAGFIVTTDQNVTESLLGLDVNLLHNGIHLTTGLLGLAVGFALLKYARLYAVVFGVIYTIVGVWGMGDANPLGLFAHINDADNVLHLLLGITGVIAYTVSADLPDQQASRIE